MANGPIQTDTHSVAQTVPTETRHLDQLRAIILLGGSVRPTPWTDAIGRSVLDLPVDETRGTVLDHWLQQSEQLAGALGLDRLPLRVLIDRKAVEPQPSRPAQSGTLRIERDPLELRGTGGFLRDAAREYGDDDWILVATARQILLEPLIELVESLATNRADVNLISHRDGVPCGLMLVRCRCLQTIPSIGFVDMKEQALPLIAATRRVRVIERVEPTGLLISTLEGYIHALRTHHQTLTHHIRTPDPFADDWRSTFSLVEDGQAVHSTAYLHDAVVLRGAKVGAGAVVARSVICSGAVVRRNQTVTDTIAVPRNGRHHNNER